MGAGENIIRKYSIIYPRGYLIQEAHFWLQRHQFSDICPTWKITKRINTIC